MLLLLLFVVLPNAISAAIPATEREALIDLYRINKGEGWTNNQGWMGPEGTECSWYGVTCDDKGSTVVGIKLPGNGLRCYLGSKFGQLQNLEEIDFSGNKFGESAEIDIEAVLFDLPKLRVQRMSACGISGRMSSVISRLTRLEVLDLSRNQILSISTDIGQLSQLRILRLEHNSLRELPPELGYLSRLEELDASYNWLTSIPPELGNLSSLEILNLSDNEIEGPIAPELGRLLSLRVLDLSGQQGTRAGARHGFLRQLPAELGDLRSLEVLNLRHSGVSGAIPPELGRLKSLRVLDLSLQGSVNSDGEDDGGFDSPIPPELGALENLEVLNLNGARLPGPIPAELRGLVRLVRLDLSINRLTGPIPEWLSQLEHLEELVLNNSGLYSPIPLDLSDLRSLRWLDLTGAVSFGSFPSELIDLTNLEVLRLASTGISGSIPTDIGRLEKLVELSLADNGLEGRIPRELGNLRQLRRLRLESNRLTGPIPVELVALDQVEPQQSFYNRDLGLGFNALYPETTDVREWADRLDPGWEKSQTLAPENVRVERTIPNVRLRWDPVAYQAKQGGYEVLMETGHGSFEVVAATEDQSTDSVDLPRLQVGETYTLRVRTFSEPFAFGYNRNRVVSEPGEEVVVRPLRHCAPNCGARQ